MKALKPLVWMHPDQLARQYNKDLYNEVVKLWYDVIIKTLFPAVNLIALELRFDSRLDVTMDNVRKTMKRVADIPVKVLAKRYAREVNAFNKKQCTKVTRSLMDTEIPNLDRVIQQFVNHNVSLISGLADDVSRKLEQRIVSGIRKGYTTTQMQSSIQYRFGIEQGVFRTIKTRMELIAVDQIGKLNGQLTRVRQQLLGIKQYTWRTRRDACVRLLHRKREGKKYWWVRPPVDGHPGEPIRCRCFAEPVMKGKK